MKVYLPLHPSRGVNRVATALRSNLPTDTILTDDYRQADLIIYHVIGRRDALEASIRSLKPRQRYAIIQYALTSTKAPNPIKWQHLWEGAATVWSYYDLPTSKLYHAPLGVDPIFYPREVTKSHIITTCSLSKLTESVRECELAAKSLGLSTFSLGNTNYTDDEVARIYSSSYYVSGLRRLEGFELPAAEGLLCGSRPVLFRQPHYTKWYGNWAEYIEETPREDVITQLITLFSKPYRSVTLEERMSAAQLFDWEPICRSFWLRCQ